MCVSRTGRAPIPVPTVSKNEDFKGDVKLALAGGEHALIEMGRAKVDPWTTPPGRNGPSGDCPQN